MITNEVEKEKRFELKINFNLIKKHDSDLHQIYLTATLPDGRARVYTKLRINPLYWLKSNRSDEGERAIESNKWGNIVRQDCRRINKEIERILGYCDDYATFVVKTDMDKWMYPFEPYSKEGFERFLKAKIANRAFEIEKSPEDFITAYIKAKEDDVNEDTALKLAEGSLYNHENALKRLKAYCQDRGKNLRWQLFDESFLLDFRKWCNETKKYAPNTITGQFSKMKEWMRVADGKGLLKSKAYEKWPTKKYDSDNIALTEDEIEAMYKLDFSALEIKEKIDPKSNIEKTRDLFIIACWTGLRFGDYSNLHKAVIDDNFIRIPTSKTNELISLPIHPLVRKIIDKYNGVLPDGIDKSHSIKHLKKCGELAGVDSITIIRKIKGGKQIIQKEPKYTFIGNHTARRSFATNQYRRGIPSATIMAITGHKTEENFLKYIKISKEEHATIIAQSWQSNP